MTDQAVATPAPHAAARTRPGAGAAMAWRQYRLERRMFWRNPSAAFFNFFLPLLFLAMFGSIYAGEQENLDVIVPGIAGMSVMSTTFTAIAMNLTFLREQGILKRMRGTPMPSSAYLAALAGNAATNTALQVGDRHHRRARSSSTRAGPRLARAAAVRRARRRDLRRARRRALARDPELRVGARVRQRGVPADDHDLRRLLRRRRTRRGCSRRSPRCCRSSTSSTGCRARWSENVGIASNATALVVLVAWGIAGAVLAVRGFSWDARRA